jgi:CII-binding regulator of phage lambda lysogenization HflD
VFHLKKKDPVTGTIGKYTVAISILNQKSTAATAVLSQTADNLDRINNELINVLADIDDLVHTLQTQRQAIVCTIDNNKVVLGNIQAILGKK